MTQPPAKRPRGRPATGRQPDKDRKAASRAALRKLGGRPFAMDLSPDQARVLDAMKEREGFATDGAAVAALIDRAGAA